MANDDIQQTDDTQETDDQSQSGTDTGTDSDKGFPAGTPVKDMTAEQQAAYWKFQARKHEDALKGKTGGLTVDDLKSRSDRLKELEDAGKSEADKAKDRETSLTSENTTLKSEAAALRAAVKYKLDEEDLAALEGVPADKVDALAARLAGKTPKAPGTTGQGNSGSGVHDKKELTADEIVAEVTKR